MLKIASFDERLKGIMTSKHRGMLPFAGMNLGFGSPSALTQQVAVDNVGAGNFVVSATSLSLSNFAIANNPNRVIILMVVNYTDGTAPSAAPTFGAQNFTLLATYTPAAGHWTNSTYLKLYYLFAPTVSTTTAITVTYAGNTEIGMNAISYYNAGQTSAYLGTPVNTRSTTNPSAAVTTTAAKSVVVALMHDNPSTFGTFSGTSPMVVENRFTSSGTDKNAVGDQVAATIGAYTSAWTVSGGTNHDMAESALEIMAA
jgi:hypothetical protein